MASWLGSVKQWVWLHNQVYGQISRAAAFVHHIQQSTLSDDAIIHLREAERHLQLAMQEAYLRRREQDGEVILIKREHLLKQRTKDERQAEQFYGA